MATLERARVQATVETKESALGSWTTAQWRPPAASSLSGAVEAIWYFEGVLTHPRERVFPDGSAELIVMLDEPHRDGDDAGLQPFPAVCINGLRTRPATVVAPRGRCRVLGIRFEPAGACALLRSSVGELLDITIDVRDALGRSAAELGERCAGAADARGCEPARHAVASIEVAAEWAERRIEGFVCDPAVRWTAAAIGNARGDVSVDAIVEELGIGRAALARRFSEIVGIAPKRFARIVRFHHAISLLAGGNGIAAAAADLSYYDQAHMYRDFSEFAGMTPGAFLAAPRYPGTASVAEF